MESPIHTISGQSPVWGDQKAQIIVIPGLRSSSEPPTENKHPEDYNQLGKIGNSIAILDEWVDRQSLVILRSRISMIREDYQRLTGMSFLVEMNYLSSLIEARCRRLELDPDLTSTHCELVHTAMDRFRRFQPYFHVRHENDLTAELMNMHKTQATRWTRANNRLKQFRRDGNGFRHRESLDFITKDVYVRYAHRLRELKKRLRNIREDMRVRYGYLKSERRETVRLLVACRRFRTVQRDRCSGVEPCMCRFEAWESGIWSYFGLPIVSMPAGPNGFAPV